MLFTGDPTPPAERFAEMLLWHATERGTSELRLTRGTEHMEVLLDGKPFSESGPAPEIFAPVASAMLHFARVRAYPWTRRVVGKRLEAEFGQTGRRSAWSLASDDIGSELTLTRLGDQNQPGASRL